MKKLHFEKKLRKHSNNTRKTWNTLNTAIRKNKNKLTDILSLLSLNSKITDPTEMANKLMSTSRPWRLLFQIKLS